MSPELDAVLVRDFPRLYRDRHGDMQHTLMCWGFTCGDGWEHIIRALSGVLESRIDQVPELRAVQVKEKFGALRFYFEPHDDEAYGAVNMAEAICSITCEVCGARPAKPTQRANRPHGWTKTVCAEHAAEWVKPLPPPAG